jgi:hypothetical protein
MSNPRRLVVYQDARHAIGACPSVNLGPHPPTMVADWMAARFAGKPMSNERWYVDNGGAVRGRCFRAGCVLIIGHVRLAPRSGRTADIRIPSLSATSVD